MTFVTNAGKLAQQQRARSQKYAQEVQAAVRQNAEVLKRKAMQFSQRQFFSLKALRKMGHPYAVRDPRPPVQAHIINKQSGDLYGKWRINVKKNSDGMTATVMNTSEHAKYMMGGPKSRMIPRPILDEAMKRTQDERRRNLRNARRRGYYRLTGH